MDFWLQTIAILSGSTAVVFFILMHIIGLKSEKINEYPRGEEIEVPDDEADYDEQTGQKIKRYRKSEEQIRWEAYSDLCWRIFWISFFLCAIIGMIAAKLGYV